jgi:class 3 adenylate cyclase
MSRSEQDQGLAELPSGTVTFFLTDVEGSTRLWDAKPNAMEAAIARHDAILHEVVREHGGVLLKHKGEGDSAFAVFGRASDAVAAAVAAQRAFGAEAWPAGCTIRVRMAIHTGEAELRERDYYGPAVNRTARLRGITHGSQTVISRATADLVRDRLADGVCLVDLGEHRLRDLERAEVVFGLVHPDLETQFPPLLSLEALPNNLPEQLTSLVGRDREIGEIRTALHEARLVTLTGAAGCGKTRLALQAAAESLDEFDDGVWFVDLAPVADAELVIQTVASTLGLQESQTSLSNVEFGASTRSLGDVVLDYLAARRLLLGVGQL